MRFYFSLLACLFAGQLHAEDYRPGFGDHIYPTPDGIQLNTPDFSSMHLIAWGAPFHSAARDLVAVHGSAFTLYFQDECPAGPLAVLSLNETLNVVFQEDRLVGWELGHMSPLSTPTGVGYGAGRATIEAYGGIEFLDSTLGTEFASNGVSGLMDDPDGVVTALWSGTICIFR